MAVRSSRPRSGQMRSPANPRPWRSASIAPDSARRTRRTNPTPWIPGLCSSIWRREAVVVDRKPEHAARLEDSQSLLDQRAVVALDVEDLAAVIRVRRRIEHAQLPPARSDAREEIADVSPHQLAFGQTVQAKVVA